MTEAADRKETLAEFRRVVNMTPAKLRHWLESEESRSVGMAPGGKKVTGPEQHESVGHHMGERILAIKARKQDELTEADWADMRKVIGYVHRHMAQRPKGDVRDTRWRRSLMNWGHDPLED
ncbi:DUF3140 domain-containing protein [Roseomonas sp. M0104]|uniref:DUF3140 domain-containing protein n=1 Tax=Teichococcus coralli TaxID=2545983 RepID=A0A845BA03_9PROT|nr:DUF3140 domain-containing protein [Pseudoroseomonas coralli]MXP62924.1 DUF3140 domain-containing protein [Pseudoroseomonas coralli]